MMWGGHGIATLAFVVVWPCLLALGVWQLQRAEEKQHLIQQFAQHTTQLPTEVTWVDLADETNLYRPVFAVGHFGHRQLLLDNQIHEKTVGYHLYTPFFLRDAPLVLWVNRGWLPADPRRENLPTISWPEGELTLYGRLARPANPALKLGQLQPEPWPWPQVVQHLDFAALSEAFQITAMPLVLLLDADQPHGFTRSWSPTFGGMKPARHYGYAVQWFGLATALLILFLIHGQPWRARWPSNPAGVDN